MLFTVARLFPSYVSQTVASNSPPINELGMTKKGSSTAASDAKTTALNHLGIAIGSKNLKTLKREEVDLAFMSTFSASGFL